MLAKCFLTFQGEWSHQRRPIRRCRLSSAAHHRRPGKAIAWTEVAQCLAQGVRGYNGMVFTIFLRPAPDTAI